MQKSALCQKEAKPAIANKEIYEVYFADSLHPHPIHRLQR